MSYVHHTILLLDDNLDDSRFTRLALQRVGVISPIQAVARVEEAQQYLCGEGLYADPDQFPAPVLVMLDMMRCSSGLEFLSWLRSQPALRRLPAVVLSSCSDIDEINRAYEHGCNSYLVKPTSFNTLLVMMQTLTQYWLGMNQIPERRLGFRS